MQVFQITQSSTLSGMRNE